MRPRVALLLLLPLLAQAQSLSFSDENPEPFAPAPARAVQAEERGILDELARLDAELQAARDELDVLTARVAELEASRAARQAELAAVDAELDARRAETRSRVRALYRLHRRGLARVMFGAEDPAELLRRAGYLLWLVRAERGPLREVAERLAGREAALDALRKDEAALVATKAELVAREATLAQERAARLTLLDDIRTRRELALRAEAELGDTRQALQSRLSAPTTSAAPSFRASFGSLPWPAQGRIVRRFGAASDPASGRTGPSLGIDLDLPAGAQFRAVFPGTVTMAEAVPGYGLTVALSHGSYTTVYAHAARSLVRPGDAVLAGQAIGVAGNTGLGGEGCCTLTFEIRYNGTPQDPLPWLGRP